MAFRARTALSVACALLAFFRPPAAVTTALLLTAQTVTAEAKGCIKRALVGGAAGHMVGHGKMGAAAGCVVGHHNANKKQQQKQEQQNGSSH